jgi:hypothetical protein
MLDLHNTGIAGFLPTLTASGKLKSINLSSNDNLVGTVPNSYGNMAELQELILSRCHLTGSECFLRDFIFANSFIST